MKGQIRRRIGGANLTEGDISKLLSVFDTQGVLSSHGGIAKFRTVNDMRDTMNESDAAFNTALDASRQSRKQVPGSKYPRLLLTLISGTIPLLGTKDKDEKTLVLVLP